jgi:hypothetical protein
MITHMEPLKPLSAEVRHDVYAGEGRGSWSLTPRYRHRNLILTIKTSEWLLSAPCYVSRALCAVHFFKVPSARTSYVLSVR